MIQNSLIVGRGQIGNALGNILKDYNPDFLDTDTTKGATYTNDQYDVLHICFPYSESFLIDVDTYQKLFKPRYTVIHSTVKPGTCRQLGAIHSPVIGRHPHLEESMRTFTKFLAGEQASEVADYFRKCGMRVYLFSKPEATEIMKKLDTDFYRLCVEYTKEIKRHLDASEIPFEAWTIYNAAYNSGYSEIGCPEYIRPNLVPIMTKIGGHCLTPNTELFETCFTKLLRELNNG